MLREQLSFWMVMLLIMLIVIPVSSLIISYLKGRKTKRQYGNSRSSYFPYNMEPDRVNSRRPILEPVLQKRETRDRSPESPKSLEPALDAKIREASAVAEASSLPRVTALEARIETLGRTISQLTVKLAALEKALQEARGEETIRRYTEPVLRKMETIEGSLESLKSLETSIDAKIKEASAVAEASSQPTATALEARIETVGRAVSQMTVRLAALEKAPQKEGGEEAIFQYMEPLIQRMETIDGTLESLQSLETSLDAKIKEAAAMAEAASLPRVTALEERLEALDEAISQLTVTLNPLDTPQRNSLTLFKR